MPKYFYRCSVCNQEQSHIHGFDDVATDCKLCFEKNSLKKIIKKVNLNVTEKKDKVGSLVKSSIEDFKRDLREEKKALQEEIHE